VNLSLQFGAFLQLLFLDFYLFDHIWNGRNKSCTYISRIGEGKRKNSMHFWEGWEK
jgi:hypothetical protein